MKTERIDQGNLEAQIKITIVPTDYEAKFNQALAKQSKSANLKGFRKGKAPVNTIRKMFGRNLLAEVIAELVNKGLEDYLAAENIEILGNPIPSENQEQIDFNIKTMTDYSFSYDIGILANLDLSGTAEVSKYDDYKVKFGENEIAEELVNIRKRFGSQKATDASVEENDILNLSIIEKAEFDDRDPFTNEIKVMPSSLKAEYKTAVIGQKVGFKFEFNIFDLEENMNEEMTKRQFLIDAPEDITAQFEAKIMEVTRLEIAELDEEFFKNAFGPDVSDEEAAKAKIEEYISGYYKVQGEAISKRLMLQKLVDENEFELPNEFLKRWLLSTNEKLTMEEVEKDYPHYVKDMRWSLIKQNLAKKFDIEVTREQIKESLIRKFRENLMKSGYGQFGNIDLDSIAENAMKQTKTIEKEYEEVLSTTVLNTLFERVHLVPKELTIEEYKEMINNLNSNFRV